MSGSEYMQMIVAFVPHSCSSALASLHCFTASKETVANTEARICYLLVLTAKPKNTLLLYTYTYIYIYIF